MDSTTGMADALLVGRMRLVSRKEDGVNGCVLGFEAASVRLSRRELSVLAAAEGGVANKLVAIEQSLSCSTVSESLQMALTKLGFASRAEFLKVMACLRVNGPDHGNAFPEITPAALRVRPSGKLPAPTPNELGGDPALDVNECE